MMERGKLVALNRPSRKNSMLACPDTSVSVATQTPTKSVLSYLVEQPGTMNAAVINSINMKTENRERYILLCCDYSFLMVEGFYLKNVSISCCLIYLNVFAAIYVPIGKIFPLKVGNNRILLLA